MVLCHFRNQKKNGDSQNDDAKSNSDLNTSSTSCNKDGLVQENISSQSNAINIEHLEMSNPEVHIQSIAKGVDNNHCVSNCSSSDSTKYNAQEDFSIDDNPNQSIVDNDNVNKCSITELSIDIAVNNAQQDEELADDDRKELSISQSDPCSDISTGEPSGPNITVCKRRESWLEVQAKKAGTSAKESLVLTLSFFWYVK